MSQGPGLAAYGVLLLLPQTALPMGAAAEVESLANGELGVGL